MTPSLLGSTSFPGPAAGFFAGAARPGANLGAGRPAGFLPGVASARLVAGLARAVPLRDAGVAGCGATSTVGGGRDGGEPFYLEGCGCGGACGGGADAAPGRCAGAPGHFPGGSTPGHAGTTAVRGELAELPDDVEPPPDWNSAFAAEWSLRHGGPVTLPEPDEGNFLTPRGDGEGDEGGGLTPRWNEGEEDRYCACETPKVILGSEVAGGSVPLLYSCDDWGDSVAIIRRAWQVLLDNQDLFVEAADRYIGLDLEDEIHDVLLAMGDYSSDPIHVECSDLGGFTAMYGHNGEYERGQFGRHLQLDVAYLSQLDYLWWQASLASGRVKRKGQVCPVIDLAATVAHELVHALGYASGDTAGLGFSSYEIENYLRYHLSRRYCVLGWGCCNWAQVDSAGTWCENFDCLVGDSRFNSDTYRIDLGRWYDPGIEDESSVGRNNVCVGTGPCDH